MRYTLFIFISLLFACTYDQYEVPQPAPAGPAPADTTNSAMTRCDSLNVTYTLTVKPIMDASCTTSGCHSAGSGNGDYTTYAGLKAKVDNGSFKQRVLEDKNMPPGGPLSAETLEKLQCWLDAGAPNN